LTLDQIVENFEIEKDGKFEAVKIVSRDEANKTYNVQFEIDGADAIVVAKMNVGKEISSFTTFNATSDEHIIRLFFEGNSMTPIEVEEEPEEKVELIAEKATEVQYKLMHKTNDELS